MHLRHMQYPATSRACRSRKQHAANNNHAYKHTSKQGAPPSKVWIQTDRPVPMPNVTQQSLNKTLPLVINSMLCAVEMHLQMLHLLRTTIKATKAHACTSHLTTAVLMHGKHGCGSLNVCANTSSNQHQITENATRLQFNKPGLNQPVVASREPTNQYSCTLELACLLAQG